MSASSPLCPGFADSEDEEANFIPGGWRNDAANDTGYYPVEAGRNRHPCKKAAKEIRDMLKDYFNSSEGAVPWQNEFVHK